MSEPKSVWSHCRRCGGDRVHKVLAEENRPWSSDDEHGLAGQDDWYILECCGCLTVTLAHENWFSGECDANDYPIINRICYPPAPRRKMPEWHKFHLFIALKEDELWIPNLFEEIYSAYGMGSHTIAAMGARAIVDFVVTSKAGDKGSFKEKLGRMVANELLNQQEADTVYATFDAGSAAAHRGHRPTDQDLNTILDITETLVHKFYVDFVRKRLQAQAAASLAARTPQRP